MLEGKQAGRLESEKAGNRDAIKFGGQEFFLNLQPQLWNHSDWVNPLDWINPAYE
jgi:hypothetical protein